MIKILQIMCQLDAPDQRLNILSKISKSEKTIPPIYEAIDFANS